LPDPASQAQLEGKAPSSGDALIQQLS